MFQPLPRAVHNGASSATQDHLRPSLILCSFERRKVFEVFRPPTATRRSSDISPNQTETLTLSRVSEAVAEAVTEPTVRTPRRMDQVSGCPFP